MTPALSLAEIVAVHGNQIEALERDRDRLAGKLDKLLFLIISTLATSVVGLLILLFQLLHK